MAESTKELVAKFSSNPQNTQHAYSGASVHPDSPFRDDHVFGNELLSDPLDDTGEFTNRARLAEVSRNGSGAASLPPTPRDSPSKNPLHRLRGSPVRTPRRAFHAPKMAPTKNAVLGSRPDVGADSPLSLADLDFDADFDTKAAFARDFSSDTRRLKGYHALLSSSTEKLTHELYEERAKSAQLQREVDSLRRENGHVARIEAEFRDLQKTYSAIKARNLALEMQVNSLQKGDKSPQLARENALLREKLMKYKKLYDESVAQQQRIREEEKDINGSSRDTVPAELLTEFQEWSAWKRANEVSDKKGATENIPNGIGARENHDTEKAPVSNQSSKNSVSVSDSPQPIASETIEALLEKVLDAVYARNGPSPQAPEQRAPELEIKKRSNSSENSKNSGTSTISRSVSAPSATSVSPDLPITHMQESAPLPDCKAHLARLEQILLKMEEKIQFQSQHAGMQESPSLPQDELLHNRHAQNVNIRENAQKTEVLSSNSADLKPHARACQCECQFASKSPSLPSSPVAKTCPACASICLPNSNKHVFSSSFSGSKLGAAGSPHTRPHSESTSKNSGANGDDTHSLMGKYMWNRSI